VEFVKPAPEAYTPHPRSHAGGEQEACQSQAPSDLASPSPDRFVWLVPDETVGMGGGMSPADPPGKDACSHWHACRILPLNVEEAKTEKVIAYV